MKLQINTDRAGGTVLLFVRPANGVYLPPKVLRLDGKSTVEEIEVVKKDMPNFFVEAVTVADGKVYTETKEIVVPPEKRVLNVEVEPSTEAYKPGEKAKVKVKLTDFDGKPFVGSTVVAIYDKSVEYISGGSNVPEIKEFFWKWRRQHHPQTETSLGRWFRNLVAPNTARHERPRRLRRHGGRGDAIETRRRRRAHGRPAMTARHGAGWRRRRHERCALAAGAWRHGWPCRWPRRRWPMATDAPWNDGSRGDAGGAGGEAAADGPADRPHASSPTRPSGSAALTTDKDGTAEVALDMPENLTTWRIKVWGMGHGTRVGEGQTDVVTRKDLIVRLQAPRFFVQNDEVVLSANVHNYLKTKKTVEGRAGTGRQVRSTY